MFSADQARAITSKNKGTENQIFLKIRDMCDTMIKDAAKSNLDYVIFKVPCFIFGLPVYDPQKIYFRLYQSLISRKPEPFQVYSTENPLELYISWKKTQNIKKKEKESLFDRISKLKNET